MGADRPEIVPLRDVPTSEVLALVRTCLGTSATPRDEAFWRWKHEDNPFGPSPGLVAVAGGRPVALRVFLRWRWTAGGQEIDAVRAVDTATHPGWRRRGLFRRLTLELAERLAAEGTAFVFNTPNPRSRAGYLAMGWEDVGRVPLRVRLRRPARVVRTLLGGSDPSRDASSWVPAGLRPVSELLADPALPELLAAWTARETRLHTPRTLEYLRWRYPSVPGAAYGSLWQIAGSSGAVAVVRIRRRRGLRELTLSELLLSDDSTGRESGRDLVERIGGLAGADYLAAVAVPGSAERDVLRRSLWLPAPAGPRLVVRPLRRSTPDPRARTAWRLSVGDLEVF